MQVSAAYNPGRKGKKGGQEGKGKDNGKHNYRAIAHIARMEQQAKDGTVPRENESEAQATDAIKSLQIIEPK